MELTAQKKKKLKTIAHKLKPIVTIGQNGLKETIHEEIEIALDCHQVIKIKLNVGDRDSRKAMINDLAKAHNSDIIQTIGNIAVFFRNNPRKDNIV